LTPVNQPVESPPHDSARWESAAGQQRPQRNAAISQEQPERDGDRLHIVSNRSVLLQFDARDDIMIEAASRRSA